MTHTNENAIVYPTEWTLGKPRGSTKEIPTGYLVRVTPPTQKTISKYFLHRSYKKKDDSLKAANEFAKKTSDECGLTRNQIRYIDENTIEVQLTQDKVMKTDAKFIGQIELYPLQAKARHDKKKSDEDKLYYVYYQDKKVTHKLTDLIFPEHKTISFRNGHGLDLRSANIKELGGVDNLTKTDSKSVSKQHDYFKMKIRELPKNEWILGKPAGTVFKRTGENIYTARATDDDNEQHARTFKVDRYDSDEIAKDAAYRWKTETSYKLNMTKNLIRIIDATTIEVELTKDRIMKTDRIFIPLLQKLYLHICISGSGMEYVGVSIDKYANDGRKEIYFHSLITGFPMVDHINGDTTDNRLQNLRYTTHSLNNSNVHTNTKYFDKIIGVYKHKDQYGKCYVATTKFRGHVYSKSFYITGSRPEETAKKQAIEFRNKLSECVDIDEGLTTTTDNKLLQFLMVKISHIRYLSTIDHIVGPDEYLSVVDLDDMTRGRLFGYYLSKQHIYKQKCKESYSKISDLMRIKGIVLTPKMQDRIEV